MSLAKRVYTINLRPFTSLFIANQPITFDLCLSDDFSKKTQCYVVDLQDASRLLTTIDQSQAIQHIKANKGLYMRLGGFFICSMMFHYGVGAVSIDPKAFALYKKLVKIGKWVIVFKGGWETIGSVLSGNMSDAKKQFLMYLLIYIILLALPLALNEADEVFSDLAGDPTFSYSSEPTQIDIQTELFNKAMEDGVLTQGELNEILKKTGSKITK